MAIAIFFVKKTMYIDLTAEQILDNADKEKRALEILNKLPPRLAHDYDLLRDVGSCLKSCGESLFYEWYQWGFSHYSPYCDGTLETKAKRLREWDSFDIEGDGTIRLSQIDTYTPQKEISAKSAVYSRLQKMWQHRLRLNTMSKEVELDGEKLTPDYLYLDLLKYGICSSKDFVVDCVAQMAVANEYNPLTTYLDKCHTDHKDTAILDTIASDYFGTTDPIYNTMVKKFLISAVARAYRAGCKVDTTLILQGGQGVGKSTFFKILAGDFFDDGLGSNVTDQNEKMRLSAHWILEWGELERIFSQRDASSIKAFLTSTHDSYRRPWGKNIETYPRHCVIVGTTNRDDFLNDSTGSRRFWVVPVAQKVDLRRLKENRAAIWGAAVQCFLNKEPWFLTAQEELLRQELNDSYQREDPWQEAIASYCQFRDKVTISEILDRVLKIEIGKQDRQAQMRVGDLLRSNGWVKKKSHGVSIWILGIPVSPINNNNNNNKTESGFEAGDTLGDTLGIPQEIGDTKKGIPNRGIPQKTEVSPASIPHPVSVCDELGDTGIPSTPLPVVSSKKSRSVKSDPLKVGDRVRIKSPHFLAGKTGEILHINASSPDTQVTVGGKGWAVNQGFKFEQLEKIS